MWSFNFFFYNRKLKRILYFACRGKTHAAASSSGEESSECAYNSDAEVRIPSVSGFATLVPDDNVYDLAGGM